MCMCARVCLRHRSAANSVRWHYSDVQYLCAHVGLSVGVYAYIYVCGFTRFLRNHPVCVCSE